MYSRRSTIEHKRADDDKRALKDAQSTNEQRITSVPSRDG